MIHLVLAMDPNGLIGNHDRLPWHYPEDLRHFKKITRGHTVVMGRKTFESIIKRNGKPLPKRHSVVATRHAFTYEHPDVTIIHDLVGYLKAHQNEELYVIGGKAIYHQSLPWAHRLHVTHIHQNHEGDVYVDIDFSDFKPISKNEHEHMTFTVYERVVQP